jgi:hypothetical protein
MQIINVESLSVIWFKSFVDQLYYYYHRLLCHSLILSVMLFSIVQACL